MSINILLSHVKGVKKAGRAAWMCNCPSHADRSPSMKITQAEDGRILIHCFAGCSTQDILGAVGLTMDDLFEDTLYHRAKPLRPGIYPRDVLKALRTEFMIVMISAFDLRKGKALNEVDMSRLDLAYERFANAVELAEIE
jgi:hypothetical protein